MAKTKTLFNYDPHLSIVNNQTNEEIKRGVVTKTCKTTEEFVKIYLNAIDEMMKLDHRLFQTLMVCLKTCSFADDDNKDGSIVSNDIIFKDMCREAIGLGRNGEPLTDDNINNLVSKLKQMNILQRYKGKGKYIINPALFVKGKIPQEVLVKSPKPIHPNKDFERYSNTPC
jgi:hypothetical protein